MILSFVGFLLLFVVIGVLSVLRSKSSNKDYLLAGQSVSPGLVALSAVATNNSGYMFVGMIGFTYSVGLSSIWLMVGWVLGDFLMSLFVHERLRRQTETDSVLSFGGLLANWGGREAPKLRALVGLITIAFLGTYAAAQLNAGSKALHVLLGWEYGVGAVMGAIIVMLYCFAGGIRASIWTDAAQSLVMISAMALMMVASLEQIGGLGAFAQQLREVSPTYLDFFESNLPGGPVFGPIMFVFGWVVAGFGVVGQPHIMVRFMTVNSPNNIGRVRTYYYAWYLLFYSATIFVGLAARLLIPTKEAFDPELALPTIASQLLPEPVVGLVLAGLFAATMSTADSQILSCTAALTRDFKWSKKATYAMTKLGTVFVTLAALVIALMANDSVFALVLIAWSGLGASFGPLLILRALGKPVPERLGMAMVIGGLLAVIAWRGAGLGDWIYEIAPGMIFGMTVYFGAALGRKRLPWIWRKA